MESILSLEELKKYSEYLKEGESKELYSTDNNIILFLCKMETEKVERFKSNSAMTLEVEYIDEIGLSVYVSPTIYMNTFSREEYLEYSAVFIIPKTDVTVIQILEHVSKGTGKAQMYLFDKTYSTISIKPIFETEMSKIVLERELNKNR